MSNRELIGYTLAQVDGVGEPRFFTKFDGQGRIESTSVLDDSTVFERLSDLIWEIRSETEASQFRSKTWTIIRVHGEMVATAHTYVEV